MVTTIAALATLWFTNQSLRATSEQSGLARQTAVTDRFAKAVEQLGNSNLDIRLGGINLLRKLSEDSEPDRKPIMQMLGAFVRTHAPNGPECGVVKKEPDLDVQTALTVIGGRDDAHVEIIDLSNTCLVWANLRNANFRQVLLTQSNLTHALFLQADLRESVFVDSVLDSAVLDGADLRDAGFQGGSMQAVIFGDAKLHRAGFASVDMRMAALGSADLRGAQFAHTDLRGASLADGFSMAFSSGPLPDLMTTDEEQVNGASVMFVRFDPATTWPRGFTPRSQPFRAWDAQYGDFCPTYQVKPC
ncbi:pentapeptide repeat-containing protein [Nocardia sp. NPDC052001]|uniref:pentapeptide repeat-containing protein n=1 Tax=Nocardia sp. NPDC052001 TaxID=3154853 RepID=UPI003415B13C